MAYGIVPVEPVVQHIHYGVTVDGQKLKKHKPLGRVLIPLHMLRHQEDVFLDDWTVPQLSQALETPVQVVGIDGFDLCDAVFEL
jgi:NifB/MoaA-like Fe-S oxidoreductase